MSPVRCDHVREATALRALLSLVLSLGPAAARAHTTIVPDEFPTIQAGVDHVQFADAETLLVRPGDYPEIVEVHWGVFILGAATAPDAGHEVKIGGLRACYVGGRPQGLSSESQETGSMPMLLSQRFENLHVSGPVVICMTNGPVGIGFKNCRLDADVTCNDLFSYPDLTEISLRNCEVVGPVSLRAQYLYADSNTFHAPLWMSADWIPSVGDNRFESLTGTAMTVRAHETSITRNFVHGATSGIYAVADDGDVHVEDNRVEGCTGDGICAYANYNSAFVEGNDVSHCGGVGIRASSLRAARRNRVTNCAGNGLDLDHYGGAAPVDGNVVGHCGGHGIMVTHDIYGDPGAVTIERNTVYACGGAAFRLQDWAEGSLVRNIACLNVGPGLDMIRAVGEWPSGCNDWFGNGDRITPASATDRRVDPLFCDLAADDVQLRSDSPLLDVPGCGRIGALGVGCEPPPVAIGLELRQDVLPLKSRGGWVTAWLEPGVPFTASEIEIATVRLNGVPVAAAQGVVGDHDRDGIADLQLRFDRVAVGRTLEDSAAATVTVTGRMRGRQFVGSSWIRVPGSRGVGRSTQPDPKSTDPVLTIHAPMFNRASGGLRVAFTLADESPARLQLLDVAGRVVLSRDVQGGPGERAVDLAGGARLPQGIYFLRLRQGTSEARTRTAIVR